MSTPFPNFPNPEGFFIEGPDGTVHRLPVDADGWLDLDAAQARIADDRELQNVVAALATSVGFRPESWREQLLSLIEIRKATIARHTDSCAEMIRILARLGDDPETRALHRKIDEVIAQLIVAEQHLEALRLRVQAGE